MSKVYKRTENGTLTFVSVREGLVEINTAMMEGKREVHEMSSITRTNYAIEYKDGRSVRLTLIDAPAPEGFTQGQEVVVQVPGRAPLTGTVAHIHTAPGYVAVRDDRYRAVSNYPVSFVSRAETEEGPTETDGRTDAPAEQPAKTDERPDAWTVASHRTLLHRFTQADKDGRALCNKSFRPRRYGNGYNFKTKAEQQSSKSAHLYTFCPRCEAK